MGVQLRKQCDSCQSSELEMKNVSACQIGLADLTSQNFAVTDKDYGTCIETCICLKCELIQPRFNLEVKQILGFYSNMKDWEYLRSTNERGVSNFSQVKKILKKLKHSPQKLLEIGSGNGYLLGKYKKRGVEVYGVEPNKTFSTFSRRYFKVNVETKGYEEIAEDQKYDTIVALDVIEHVVSVSDFMKKISTLLSPGGVAIVVTPNKDSLIARILDKKWWHIRPPHLYYFTPKSFKNLANRHGLEIKKEKQFYWILPLGYLMDSVQRMIFKRVLIPTNWIKIPMIINTFDSKMFVLKKKNI